MVSTLDAASFCASLVALVFYEIEHSRLRRKVRRAREVADLWRDLRTVEGAAEREQTPWAHGEVARIRAELTRRGEKLWS